MILVTGGAGFIGSNFVLDWLSFVGEPIVCLDKLTYAGRPDSLASLRGDARFAFMRGDICDRELVRRLLNRYRPRAVVHLAAESHVDRAISAPAEFVQTNVLGTFSLLEEARRYWESLQSAERSALRFLHVSTDEVYGTLEHGEAPSDEMRRYSPRNPYAAAKAGADHLVRAYYHTYGFPTIVAASSNNYGPRQLPEKLVPLTICRAVTGRALPVYGDGSNVRDWIHVSDHCRALRMLVDRGCPGRSYHVSARCERTNVELVRGICRILDELVPPTGFGTYSELITFVSDRPGHDFRYALDPTRLESELGWRPLQSLDQAMRATVRWYIENREWVAGAERVAGDGERLRSCGSETKL